MSDNEVTLTICDKCGIVFDINDNYDKILIAKKNRYGYEWLHFCPKCGQLVFDAINALLPE